MLRVRVAIVPLVLAALLAACGAAHEGPRATGPTTPSGSPTPEPTPTGSPLPLVELKLRVLDALAGSVDWCDPDVYPVGRGTELQNARRALPQMQRDAAVYDAILQHLGIPHDAELSTEQLVQVYRAYKLVAHDLPVQLVRDGGVYRFELVVLPTNGGYDDKVLGHVTTDGTVTIDHRITGDGGAHYFKPNCPICLARNMRIATPGGFVRVQDVRVGMAAWSTDVAGERIRAVVIAVGRTAVPPTHRVVRLVLLDGRTVLASPGHPTPDGRTVGSLRAGMAFDGSIVVSARRIRYAGGFTYDLLPSGPTGTYFANGVLLGSTLSRHMSGSAPVT